MGTLNWTITSYGGDANKNAPDSLDIASGAAATSASAATVAGFTPSRGHLVKLTASEAMWVRFGGRTAAVGTGHYLAPDMPHYFEIAFNDTGAVSAIDVS